MVFLQRLGTGKKQLAALFILFLTTASFAFCQTLPRSLPGSYSGSEPINHVRSWYVVKPVDNPNELNLATPAGVARMTTQYFDGLGRPIQTVIKQGSLVTGGSNSDMISMTEYDEFGRERYTYLPTPANNAGGNSHIDDGLFKLNPFQQQQAFYNSHLSGQTGEVSDGKNWAYSRVDYENSPLNRPIETYAPGINWSGTHGESSETNRRSVKTKYWLNTQLDSVRIWNVEDVPNWFGSYSSPSGASGIYPAGQLQKLVTVDEHGKQVIEFTDKSGKTILKKVQLTALPDTGAGKGHTGWLCTYYIYDNLGNLRCVVPPRVVYLIRANWLLTNATYLHEFCFRYEYDEKNRMIAKKVPGAGRVLMIYDARDRLVMVQDSLMRGSAQKKWLYTKYDDLNRPIITGFITDNANYNNASYHRLRADTSISYPNVSGYTNMELTRTFYDDYGWRSGEGNPLNNVLYTDNNSYLLSPSNSNWPYPQEVVASIHLKGLVTGTKTRVLNTSTFLYTVNFYDEKGRLIQVQSTNTTGGTDVATTQYSWHGQPLFTIQKQQKQGTNAQSILTLTQLTYDSLWRLSTVQKKVSHSQVNGGSMPSYWTTTLENEYDALGQLTRKKLAPAFNEGEGLESLDYEYNIRGWVLGANRDYTKDTTNTDHYFGFDLGYDKTDLSINGYTRSYAAAQYNGNIGGMLWKSTGDDQVRKYDFTYDAANRLTNADFNQFTNTDFSKNAGIDFSVSGLTYDEHGNILTMNQRGWKLGGSETIDSLLYTYSANKLKNVLDRKNDTATRLGDFRSSKAYMDALGNNKLTTVTDYTYDVAGNVKSDKNKDITTIRYNYLNLPDSIVTLKGVIKYQYDAAGNKHKKTVIEGSRTITTLYLGGAVFRNDTLEFIAHEEGRIRKSAEGDTLVYDCMIKDHLGNVRMVLSTEQLTTVYPVATMEPGTSANEEQYYANLPETRTTSLPSGYPANTPSGNTAVAKVSGGTGSHKIGPANTLKVMAGDTVRVMVNSWWKSSETPSSPANPLTDLVALLNNSIGSIGGSHGFSEDALESSGVFSPSVTEFLNSQTYNSSKPKAYLNWVLFDEQFNFVANSSGFEQVGASDEYKTHVRSDLTASKNGYLYIYVSNVTENIDVFFDNLWVQHVRGPILEETHYSPFGLTMAGISSKALAFGGAENRYKFNEATELNADFGLSWYETMNRSYDPQIGRFWQIDEFGEVAEEWSPYVFAYNNPISYNDPLGLFTEDPKETSTPDKPKELSEVVVVSIPKGHWAKQRLYYDIMRQLNRRGATIDQIMQPSLQEMMYRYDGITNHRNRVSEMTGESDKVFLEGASWFIPTGALLKVTKLRKLVYLFKWKRGKNAAKATEEIIEHSDEIVNASTNPVVKSGLNISKHAAERMAERGITEKMVETAIEKGVKYFDPKNKTFAYVIKNGFASGKDLLVGVNTITGKVTTVIRGNNLVKSSFIPQ